MIKFLGFFTAILFSFSAFSWTNGQIQNAPYEQPLRNLIDYAAVDGQHVLRTAKATWTYTMGNCSGTNPITCTSPVKLPKNAFITRSWMYVVSQPQGTGTTGTTFAVQCNTANNIYSATDVSTQAAGSFVEGASTGASSAFKNITADCNIKFLTVPDNLNTGYNKGGKINVFVQYFVHE